MCRTCQPHDAAPTPAETVKVSILTSGATCVSGLLPWPVAAVQDPYLTNILNGSTRPTPSRIRLHLAQETDPYNETDIRLTVPASMLIPAARIGAFRLLWQPPPTHAEEFSEALNTASTAAWLARRECEPWEGREFDTLSRHLRRLAVICSQVPDCAVTATGMIRDG